MSKFWSPIVHKLEPYVPGEQPKISDLIKLNTNENPYGPAPSVIEAIKGELGNSLRLYPDPNASALTTAISDYYGVKQNQVFVGNGSDEVLAHAFQALLKHEQAILFPDITYSFYPVYCRLYQVNYQTIPINDVFEININDYDKPNDGIIFPNPNAPTGIELPLNTVEQLLQQNTDSVVIVDEAYIDFGGTSAIELVGRYANLLVIQTFSKSRSLAGLRVGFAVGHEDLITALERVKNSFNSYPLDRLAIAGAVAAIKDQAYFEVTKQKIIDSRNELTDELKRLGFEVLPSTANFVFARHKNRDAAELSSELRKKSIIVRHFTYERINQFLRITVGTNEECLSLIKALKEILNET